MYSKPPEVFSVQLALSRECMYFSMGIFVRTAYCHTHHCDGCHQRIPSSPALDRYTRREREREIVSATFHFCLTCLSFYADVTPCQDMSAGCSSRVCHRKDRQTLLRRRKREEHPLGSRYCRRQKIVIVHWLPATTLVWIFISRNGYLTFFLKLQSLAFDNGSSNPNISSDERTQEEYEIATVHAELIT